MSIAALVVSIVSAIVAVLALYKNWIDSRASSRENDFRARQQYNAEVRRWAADCTKALSDAIYVACGSSDERLHNSVISNLSALLEQGRLFFPNDSVPSRQGSCAIAAREGLRPRILDWLAYAIRICSVIRSEYDPEAEQILKRLQAGYTSDVQLVLDPRHPLSRMSSLSQMLRDGEFMNTGQTHPYFIEAKEFLHQRHASSHGNSTFRN